MPSLLDYQRAMRRYLFESAADASGGATDNAALENIGLSDAAPGTLERLSIYRNTCISTLMHALQLSYPAVRRVVGEEFFEAAARQFMDQQRPMSANLNTYGGEFSDFLHSFAPAAGLPYLADLAQLEWAVNRALHASDGPGMNAARWAALQTAAGQDASAAQLIFLAHPSVSALRLQYPADVIWLAVLEQDEARMAAIDLSAGPAYLLVERDAGRRLQVRRLNEAAWRLTERLCAGAPLQSALDAALGAALAAPAPCEAGAQELRAGLNAVLADHLSSGRFVDFQLSESSHGDL